MHAYIGRWGRGLAALVALTALAACTFGREPAYDAAVAGEVTGLTADTLLLGEGYAAGSISEEQMTHETVELERMVARFVRNIQALATTTIERLLRGIQDLLMTTLRQVTGLPSFTLAPSDGTVWGVGPA